MNHRKAFTKFSRPSIFNMQLQFSFICFLLRDYFQIHFGSIFKTQKYHRRQVLTAQVFTNKNKQTKIFISPTNSYLLTGKSNVCLFQQIWQHLVWFCRLFLRNRIVNLPL